MSNASDGPSCCLLCLGNDKDKMFEEIFSTIMNHPKMKEKKSEFAINKGYIYHKNEIELVHIDKLSKFIYQLEIINRKETLLYRGHTNLNFIADPAVFRTKRLEKLECELYQELVLRCPRDFLHCTSHLDFLAEMQHYGLPTRLLDITTNPLIALYFAAEDCDSRNPGEVIVYQVPSGKLKYENSDTVSIFSSLALFLYKDQKKIHEKSIKLVNEEDRDIRVEKFKINTDENIDVVKRLVHEIRVDRPSFNLEIDPKTLYEVVLVKAARKNERMIRQEGAFAIFGLSNFEKESENPLNKYRYKENGKRIIFIIDKKKNILDGLNNIGINKSFVYPEIEHVADYLKKQCN